MTEYRYKKLTEDELRRLEPGAEIWVRDHRDDDWQGPVRFRGVRSDGRVMTNLIWNHAAIRDPVEQVITMDREWQTRDGRAVTLYCVDAPGPYPVHGRIDGERYPTAWCANGQQPMRTVEHLIAAPDWREQIPWSALADWVQWVARDSDGSWWAFGQKPHVESNRYHTQNVGGLVEGLEAIRMPEGPTDWREAIAQRPQSKGETQ